MFDPLHKWLGIPPSEQPPNDYRLLGLAVFEDDPEVIDAAADRDLAYLHDLTNGEHGDLAEELANRISAARIKLLHPKRKAEYDAQLRAEAQVPHGLDQLAAEQHPHESPLNGGASHDAASVLGMPPGVTPTNSVPAPVPPSATQVPAPNVPVPHPSGQQPVTEPSSRHHSFEPKTSPPKLNKHAPTTSHLKRRRSPLFAWGLGVLPGVLVLGYLVYSLVVGNLRLDGDKLEKLGVPPEQAAALSRSDQTEAEGKVGSPSKVAAVPAQRPPTSMPEADASATPPSSSGSTSRPSAPRGNPGVQARNGSGGPPSTIRPGVPLPAGNRPSPRPGGTNFTPIIPPKSPSLAGYLPGGNRQPLPDASAVEEKMQTVSDLYETKYRSAKTVRDKIAVADEMVVTAEETDDDPVGVFALYRVARGIYLAEGAYEPVLDIIDKVDETFTEVDVEQLKLDALSTIRPPQSRSDQFIKTVISLATDCLRKGLIAEGLGFCELIGDDIRRVPLDSRLWMKELRTQLSTAQALFDEYESSAMEIERDPSDEQAQFHAGKYLCLVEGRWAEGLPRLAKGSDPGFREVAEMELDWISKTDGGLTGTRRAPDGMELALADAWFEIMSGAETSFEKRVIGAHVKPIYQSARRTAEGLEARKIEQRLRDASLTEPIEFASARPINSVDTRPPGSDRNPANRSGIPRLLRTDSWDSNSSYSSQDYAQVRPSGSQSRNLMVGMGNHSSGQGEAAAGIELQDANQLTVSFNLLGGNQTHSMPTTKVGFVIDYHTGSGYTQRVFLNCGINAVTMSSSNPPWGKGGIPDRSFRLAPDSQYRIDLGRYAPPDWVGRCWFAVYMRDTGMNQSAYAVVTWDGRP